jgi:penicillin-binding protein 1A
MHRQLVAGAWVGFNDNNVTMGNWGEGARSALPIVGDVFQQAERNRWIDSQAEFDIPRRKAQPARPAENPLIEAVNDLLGRIFKRRQ